MSTQNDWWPLDVTAALLDKSISQVSRYVKQQKLVGKYKDCKLLIKSDGIVRLMLEREDVRDRLMWIRRKRSGVTPDWQADLIACEKIIGDNLPSIRRNEFNQTVELAKRLVELGEKAKRLIELARR